MKISATAFTNGGWIPVGNTQEGKDLSPELNFSEIPEQAVSLVLVCYDPDAPDPAAPQRIFTHWVVYNIDPKVTNLPEGVKIKELSPGACEGLNDRGSIGYIGPKPPIGTHRYYFTLYAIDRWLSFPVPPDRKQMYETINGKVIASAETMGVYKLGHRDE